MTHAASRRTDHPGSQSTTIWKPAEIFGLAGPLGKRAACGMPTFGSRTGMTMLAGRLVDPPSGQETLGAIDMTVQPNAFGARWTRPRPTCPSQDSATPATEWWNNRLAAAGYLWAFSALTASPGARAHYDRRKTAGDRHSAAQRNLFARLLGCLHHCLTTRQHYDENTAFPAPAKLPTAA